MIWFAVDKDETERLFLDKPVRDIENCVWSRLPKDTKELSFPGYSKTSSVILPKGTIEGAIGFKLTWEDNPFVLDIVDYPITRQTVVLGSRVIDYIKNHKHFDYVPEVDSKWFVDEIRVYPNVNNGYPVVELSDKDGNWLRLPKDLVL